MNKFRLLLKDEQGASAVEFALVLPFLLMILFMIFELSWLISSQTILNHATFQAARTASLAKNEGLSSDDASELAITRAVENFWLGSLEEDDVTVTFDESGEVCQVTVQASLEYIPLTGWFDTDSIPERIGSKAVTPY